MQWTGVKRLGQRHMLLSDLLGPEGIRRLSLLNTYFGQMGIGPSHCLITVQLGPTQLGFGKQRLASTGMDVAVTYIPFYGTVISFGNIVYALTMASEK